MSSFRVEKLHPLSLPVQQHPFQSAMMAASWDRNRRTPIECNTNSNTLENAMTKSPVAIIAAIIAAAMMLASSAQAGIKIRLGFGGPLPAFTAHGGGYHGGRHYHRKRYLARRVVKKEKTYVAKRKTSEPKVAKAPAKKPVEVAKADPAPEADVIADSENSSITSGAFEAAVIDPAVVTADEAVAVQPTNTAATTVLPAQKPVKAAGKLDCKKFFPSVGMTLTVPCE
jgi:hypothetical protein